MWDTIRYHASGVEIFQTIIAHCGLLFGLWSLLDAIKDSRALARRGVNGARQLIARGGINSEIERVIVQSSLCLIGLCSLFLAPPDYPGSQPFPESLQMIVTRGFLMWITLVKAGGGILQRRERMLFTQKIAPKIIAPSELAPPPGRDIA